MNLENIDIDKSQLIKAGAITGLGLGGFLLVRKIVRSKRNADGTKTNTAPALNDLKINGSNLTITPTDAAVYANTLYGAMLNFGTDEEAIFSTMDEIITKDDMLLVIKAFGMKKYMWGARTLILGQDFNLIGWLRKELSSRDIKKIKTKFDTWGIPI